jgi:4-alpha-glucanotransferase
LFISLERLVEEELLAAADTESVPTFSAERVDYEAASVYKLPCLHRAAVRFEETGQAKDPEFRSFCSANAWWLDGYTLFVALKEHFSGAPWYEWPRELRDREGGAVVGMKARLADKILQELFFQYALLQAME